MDRDSWTARTDNIVVVDPGRRRLVWIPRDLWSEAVGDRVNEAFGRGGHDLLQAAVGECGFPVATSVVLLRAAVERVLERLRISVPVDRARRYWYPMTPTSRLQDGAKLVAFDPPAAVLEGERIHQWLGARRSADPAPPRLPDLDRIRRQQVFVRRLFEDGFDFGRLLEDPTMIGISSQDAIDLLSRVRADWDLQTMDAVEPATIGGKKVLVRRASFLRAFRSKMEEP